MNKETNLCEFMPYKIGSKGTCPSCGRQKCFTYYVWKGTNEIIDSSFGICDHITKCGYNSQPWDSNQWEELKKDHEIEIEGNPKPTPKPVPPFIPLPSDLVIKSSIFKVIDDKMEIRQNNLTDYFLSLPFMPVDKMSEALIRYHVGITQKREIIWWQIDNNNKVHTGKVMKYLPNGHRDKSSFGTWIHNIMVKNGSLSKDWSLKQCLFGLHLISRPENSGKAVGIVESEKTALVCSIFRPNYIWLSCGGIKNLSTEKLKPVFEQKRRIELFPDHDGIKEWHSRLDKIKKESQYWNITINPYVQDHWKETDGNTADILDILIRIGLEHQKEASESDKAHYLLGLTKRNEALKYLIEKLDLKVITKI